jgi:hypothetical protein
MSTVSKVKGEIPSGGAGVEAPDAVRLHCCFNR